MISAAISDYLDALTTHAAQVYVPGLGISSRPIPLDAVFLEPQLERYSSAGLVHSTATDQDALARKSASATKATRVFENEQKIVILGDPGQGKTTLLREYARTLVKNLRVDRIPMLIELGQTDLAGGNESSAYSSLWNRMPKHLRDVLGRSGWKEFCHLLRADRVVVLVDALDELRAENRPAVQQALSALGGNQVVLTSRPSVYWLKPLGGFREYQLQYLNGVQISNFATNFCVALAPQFDCEDYGPALRRVLVAARGQATALARNPLLLSFMCLAAIKKHAEGKIVEFPVNAVPLISECLKALVDWQAEHKVLPAWPRDLSYARVIRVLAPLALATFKAGSRTIKAETVEGLDEFDRGMFHHLLLAQFVERREGDYGFPVETMREFFGAHAIAHAKDPYAEVRPHLHDPDWQQLIVYSAGCLEGVRASAVDLAMPRLSWIVVKAVEPLAKICAGFFGLTLGRGRKGAEDIIKETTKELGVTLSGPLEKWLARSRRSTEFFVMAILRHHCRYDRFLKRDLRLALRCVGAAKGCTQPLARRLFFSTVASLAEMQHSPEGYSAIEQSLTRAATCREIRNLLLITGGYPGHLRATLVGALKDVIFEPSVLDCLVESITDKEAGVRRSAEYLLKGVDDPAVVKRLLPLACDSNLQVRKVAHKLLRTINSTQWVREWILQFSYNPDPAIRGRFVAVVAAAAYDPLLMDRFIELFRDPKVEVRQYAAYAWKMALDDPRFREELARRRPRSTISTSESASTEIIEVPKQLSTEERFHQLLNKALGNKRDVYSRECALNLLPKELSDPWARSGLLTLMQDDNHEVRKMAVTVLSRSKSVSWARDEILKLSGDEDEGVRSSTAYVLDNAISEPWAQSALVKMSRDRKAEVRRGVAWCLENAASEKWSRDCLLQLCSDRDPNVRSAAASSLTKVVSDPLVRERFIKLIGDEDVSWNIWHAYEFQNHPPDCAVVRRAGRFAGRTRGAWMLLEALWPLCEQRLSHSRSQGEFE